MRFGIDFDNTIVCYDQLFHRVAVEKGLIDDSVPVNKGAVRDYLRSIGHENTWVEMQGYVYGPRLPEADAFPGVLESLRAAQQAGHEVFIVSHKTQHPYAGPKYDLHASALEWMTRHGVFSESGVNLPRDHVYLELTKASKLQRIGRLECDYFIDDLPELLAEADFPADVRKVLFDPADCHAEDANILRMDSWTNIGRQLLAA